MAKVSRHRRRAALTKARKTRSNFIWYVIAGVIVVVGVGLIMMSQTEASSPTIGEHWHAAFGVNVCGEWIADAPEFHYDAEHQSVQAGIHSHADGLIHTHPFASAEAGDRATVGKFLEYGGWSADEDSFELWDGQEHKSGDDCNGEEAEVRWSVNGEEQSGNISSYRQQDGDVIALALLPPDQEIGEPPSAAALAAPSDLPGNEPQTDQTSVIPVEPDVTTDTGAPTDTSATPDTTAAPTTTP